MSVVKYGDVVQEVKINIDRSADDHEFFIAGEHMDSNNIHITRRGKFSESDVGPAFTRLFRPGQVLYGSRRTYLRKVAVADFEGITSNTTFVLETKDNSILLQELLPYIMLTESFSEYAIKNSKGSTNPYILFKDLAAYQFDLPSIEEQRELVSLLGACDRAKEAYKRLLKQTDEVVKSQFIEMFGDPEKQKDNLTFLGDHINVINGYAFKGELFGSTGLPVIKIGNVNRADFSVGSMQFYEYDEGLSRFEIKPGDILISLTGTVGKDDFGNVCIVPDVYDRYYLNQRNAKLELHGELVPEYVIQLFRNDYIRKTLIQSGTGVRQCHLHNRDLEGIKFVLPKKEQQDRFAAFVQQSDKSKFVVLQATISKLLSIIMKSL